ncbi:hypothetical protein MML48_6g00013072 [Holotrichia oblita]|uniref:Uncharacterized protein n=1 Tax=Holotrichia oblita TaxID=644536 RepID=A0ACB9SZG7_HOLOL|nr:hypothetical protein MML48_6g00013072 [Holotrichia oblita]
MIITTRYIVLYQDGQGKHFTPTVPVVATYRHNVIRVRATEKDRQQNTQFQRHVPLVLGCLLLVLPFLPATNLVVTVGFVVAERVLYIPSTGCILLIVYGIQLIWNAYSRHRQTVICLIFLVLTTSCLRTVIRNKDWRSRESLLRQEKCQDSRFSRNSPKKQIGLSLSGGRYPGHPHPRGGGEAVAVEYNIYLYIEPFTQDYYWRDYAPGDIPYDAVEVANDGKYIGQVYVNGGVVPATIYSHLGNAHAELHGRQIINENIKILCCPDHSKLYWEYADFNRSAVGGQMRNAILGGFHNDVGKVFIGKANHEGEWKVTKIILMGQTYILTAWKNADGSMLHLKQFYILKYHSNIPGTSILTCGAIGD